ncbi:M23 family metallopeptidase [Streptomyces sp. 8P21H-1]|nr:M23 family metallopeptidase [Streptomyces sp. 8P21H-1]
MGWRPSVSRGWEPPATAYGSGHRGVDLAAAPGAPVRAVAPGRVSFAGRVAGRGVVSVELAGTGEPPLRTTYEPVRASLRKGTEVAAGEAVGVLEPPGSHCPSSCLHWGLRRADTYLDPLSLLPPWLLGRGPSRLLPVTGVPRTPTEHRVHRVHRGRAREGERIQEQPYVPHHDRHSQALGVPRIRPTAPAAPAGPFGRPGSSRQGRAAHGRAGQGGSRQGSPEGLSPARPAGPSRRRPR